MNDRDPVMSELFRYLMINIEDPILRERYNANPLLFWESHLIETYKLFYLKALAKFYLCMKPSEGTSEQMFSRCGQAKPVWRARLKNENFEAQMISHKVMRNNLEEMRRTRTALAEKRMNEAQSSNQRKRSRAQFDCKDNELKETRAALAEKNMNEQLTNTVSHRNGRRFRRRIIKGDENGGINAKLLFEDEDEVE